MEEEDVEAEQLQQRREAEEQQRREAEELQRQEALEQKKREGKKLEIGLKKKMSVGHLKTMHREAKTFGPKTTVQIVEKHYDASTGRLKSVALSDGAFVSQNVLPLNDQAAEGMNELHTFDLIEINCAHVHKDTLILEDIDQLEVSTKDGTTHQISGPILGLEVTNLKRLNPESLQLWGANFQMETEIEFNSSKKIPNPNETFMRADPVLMEVGGSSTDHPHGQKRKLLE